MNIDALHLNAMQWQSLFLIGILLFAGVLLEIMECVHAYALSFEEDLLLDGQVEHLIIRILFIVIKHVLNYIYCINYIIFYRFYHSLLLIFYLYYN